MSYTLSIHSGVREDVMEIFLYIDQNSPLQADRFAESVLEEYDRLLIELNNQVFLQNQRIVKSRSIGKFKRYLMYYLVDKNKKRVDILAIQYGGRDPGYVSELINGRLDG